MSTTDQRPRTPDGRRGGPQPVFEPADEDRDQVAELARQGAERRQREAEAMHAAAEPAGVPPSDDQRQAIDALREKSAQVRGPAARALRRQPMAVGTVYDDERDQVADLLSDARDRRLDAADQRGTIDPALENETAGFPPEVPNLPGQELFGVFDCPNCGTPIERPWPGYVDWDLASRDLVCHNCGGVVKRGGAEGQGGPVPDELAEEAPNVSDQQQAEGQIQPPGAQTSAQSAPGRPPGQGTEAMPTGEPGQSSGPGAQPLSPDERAELDQLRRERDQRERSEQDGNQAPPPAPPPTRGRRSAGQPESPPEQATTEQQPNG